MNLQIRLTLWSILAMAAIVSFVSALDLIEEINRQFDLAMKRSAPIRSLANNAAVRWHSNHDDAALREQLIELAAESQPLVEIAVCDSKGIIISDIDEARIGTPFTPPNAKPLLSFEQLAYQTKWWRKAQILILGGRARNGESGDGALEQSSYQITDPVTDVNNKPVAGLTVRVVIDAALIRTEIIPAISTHVGIAIASILGAMFAALVFSSVAFRPLGKLGQMLDLLAKGEYELQQVAAAKSPSGDQFGAVASKVSLLGEQLRGKEFEISDLKGNFERLLEELEDAVFIFGRDRRLIAAAGAVDKFLPGNRADLIGRSLVDVFPPSTSLGLLLAQATQTGRPIRNRRVPIDHMNGAHTHPDEAGLLIALLSMEFLDASAAGMMIRLRDPEATRQIGRQLQTADRLSAISRLTGGVAHEVKNPLNAMLMHVELARMKLNHGDYDLVPQIDVISNEIMRLDRVVKTFLDFTRPVQLSLVDVPLKTFLCDIVDLSRPQAEAAGITFTVDASDEPVMVTVDLDLMKQALLNIVVNGIEAMPEGGTMRFESTVKGDNAEIRITDSGPGIPADVRDKIYNLYFTTKQTGSGIGLAMTFRIVQLHDGTIDFSSEPGKGTTFVIRLPLAVLSA